MTVAQTSHVSDAELVLRARAGDSAALGALYVRYFDCVYDFVLRTLRDRAAAEDVVQDTFVKASKSLGNLANARSFKSWLFSIARRTALNHLRQARPTVSLTVPTPDREDYHLNVVDQDRFSDPAEAAQAAALGSVVWEAAAGLDPGLYTVLDLHVRQGLESPEIAEALRISRNHAAVKLNRTKTTMRRLVTALYLLRQGRRDCSALDATLELEGATLLTPATRKLIERHAGGCATCAQSRMKLVSPESVFGALAVIPLSSGLLPKILLALGVSAATGAGAATGNGAGMVALGASTTGKGALMPLLTLAVGTAGVVTAAFAVFSLLDPLGNVNMVASSTASAPQQSSKALSTAGQPTTPTAGPQAPRPPGIEMIQAAETAPFTIVPLPSASDAPGGPPVQAAPPARPQPGAGPAFLPPPTPPAPAPNSSVDRPPGRLDAVTPPATASAPPTTSPLPEPPTVPTPSPEPQPTPLPHSTPDPAPSAPPPGPTPSSSPPPPGVAVCLPPPAHGNVCPPGREDGPPGKSGSAPGHAGKLPSGQGGKAW